MNVIKPNFFKSKRFISLRMIAVSNYFCFLIKELFEVDLRRVFGLSISSGQLISHRIKRLRSLNNTNNADYVDERLVALEIRNANFIFERGGFTVINVSNKPVETTANEILNMMATRFEYRGRRLDSPYQQKSE